MTVALDARLIENSIREFEKTPPVKRASLTELLSRVNQAIDMLEFNWSGLPDELRRPIRLGIYQITERKLRFHERIWAYLFLLRFAMDREVLSRYFETAARLENTLFDLIERDDPRYSSKLRNAIDGRASVAAGASNRHTKEEWSEWLRSL